MQENLNPPKSEELSTSRGPNGVWIALLLVGAIGLIILVEMLRG